MVPDNKRTPAQKKSLQRFDVLVMNLKKLLAKVPGGSSMLASVAAAMILLKENEYTDSELLDENFLLNEFNIEIQRNETIQLTENVEREISEELGAAPTNTIGGGKVAGNTPNDAANPQKHLVKRKSMKSAIIDKVIENVKAKNN